MQQEKNEEFEPVGHQGPYLVDEIKYTNVLQERDQDHLIDEEA